MQAVLVIQVVRATALVAVVLQVSVALVAVPLVVQQELVE